jgi:two-component system, OmpR family, sensor histidine kinase TctE
MNARADSTPSIRRRLLVTLFLPAAVVLLAGLVADYLFALRPFTQIYDRVMLESALVIAAHVQPDQDGQLRLTLPPDALTALQSDSQDSIFFRVATADGAFVAGDADLPVSESLASNPAQFDAEYRGAPVRVVSYRTYTGNRAFTVTMGETTHKRDALRDRVLLSALLADALVLGLILALIYISVRMSLGPLREVEEQVSRRSAGDLTPLAVGQAPTEIHSMVKALNRLFRVVRETAASQRQFLDNAAHQLRTPLAGIQAQLELMAADEKDASRQERLRRILDGARRMSRTTQELLMLARADEAANPNWQLEEVDLASIVESAIASDLAAAEAEGIDLGAQIQAASVEGVSWLLAEAVRCLVDNAIAHTPRGGSVTVGCGVDGGAPYLEVVDTGIGIPAVERERVVERFFRATNARGVGSGLGLAIVNDVVGLHSGQLAIGAGQGGVGTAVRITFPRAALARHPDLPLLRPGEEPGHAAAAS